MKFSKYSLILLLTFGSFEQSFANDEDIKINQPNNNKVINNVQVNPIPNQDTIPPQSIPQMKQDIQPKQVINPNSPFSKKMEEIAQIKNNGNKPQVNNPLPQKILTKEEQEEENFKNEMKKKERQLSFEEKMFDFEMKQLNLQEKKEQAKARIEEQKRKIEKDKEQVKEKKEVIPYNQTVPYFKEKFSMTEQFLNDEIKKINKTTMITDISNFLLYKDIKTAYISKQTINMKVNELLKNKEDINKIKNKLLILEKAKRTNNLEELKEYDKLVGSELNKLMNNAIIKQATNIDNGGGNIIKVKEGDIFENIVFVDKVEKEFIILKVN